MQQVLDFMNAANLRQEQFEYSLWAAQGKQGNLIGFIGWNYTGSIGLSDGLMQLEASFIYKFTQRSI